MGQSKQLLPIDGQPMVRRVVEAVCAARLDQVIVVVGDQAQAVTGALSGLAVDVVTNQDWLTGMSTSLRSGLAAVRPEIEAALIVLADQPALGPALLQQIVAHYAQTRAPIVVPVYEGKRGNPVLFDRRVFAELRKVEGDKGGRGLLARYEDQVSRLPVGDPAVILDVDTQDDYRRATTLNTGAGSS